uniref:hemolysin family protein n=1 Tax=Acetatifactor sp. TaxID=1872090 RepID=UPI0040577FF6
MDDGGPTASMIVFFLLLFVDMFFYGFGTASSMLTMKDIEKREEAGSDKKTRRLKIIVDTPAEYVNTVQLIVTLVNVVIGFGYVGLWSQRVEKFLQFVLEQKLQLKNISIEVVSICALLLTVFVLLYIVLTFGVLLPKKIAARMSEKWAYACITPVHYITVILKPLTGLVTVTVNGILFLFGVREKGSENDVTEEEIINMVNEGHEQGVILASEAEMISNIFEYGDKEAQDIMTHRNNIIAIDSETCLKDAIDFMITEKNSRYPVYEENIDHIIGILHLKDAMRVPDGESKAGKSIKEIDGLLREPNFVPQTKNIDELFKEMQSEKLQMVIVVDEYGQTDGLVAMEDILEEIVGNILDEYDEEQEYIEEKGEDEYLMEGKTPLEELEEHFDIDFTDEEFETLNGFLISKLDRIPDEDEEFDVDYQGYNFKILSVENKMIQSVLVTRLPVESNEDKTDNDAEDA